MIRQNTTINRILTNKKGGMMNYTQLKFSVTLLLLGLGLTLTQAQEVIIATGGNSSSTGGSVSYSVGQATYATSAGSNGSVSEGIQQPYEISIVTELETAKNITLSIAAYPNPTIDYLTLEVKDMDYLTLTYQLYDMQGKLLQNKKITSHQTNITMSNLVPATYFIKVIQNNQEIKTIKIIKH